MKAVFVLLKKSTKPIGGYKMVYEYANALEKRGHKVEIIYYYGWSLNNRKDIPIWTKKIIYSYQYFFAMDWFPLQKNIKKKKVWSLKMQNFAKADVVIATAAQTAYPVAISASCPKIYFIQGYESWTMEEEELKKTYCLGMHNIVIAEWLKQKIYDVSESRSIVIHNGIDISKFYETLPQAQRSKYSLSFMYHIDDGKGIPEGLKVIDLLKEKYPQLSVKMFGAYPKGHDVPDWVDYTEKANVEQLRTIYNNTQVFLSTSREEGFGLTGAESMVCGCVLVSTRTNGVLEYANDGENALIAEIGNVNHIYSLVVTAFENEALREQLSKAGKVRIQNDFVLQNGAKSFTEATEKLVYEI